MHKNSLAGPIVPREQTLKKYGLDLASWTNIALRQNGVCYVCGKLPKSGRLVVDHEHVRGFKKMSPADRARHVRGLLCWRDNYYTLARGATVKTLTRAADYLIEYEVTQGRRHPMDRSTE